MRFPVQITWRDMAPSTAVGTRIREEAAKLEEFYDRITSCRVTVEIESMVVVGRPFAEILRIAADHHFSLIVMGIRGRHQGGTEEILLGSTAEKVLRAARIPVVCVPPEANGGAK
jgi:nucleotide-binding universal stress UspA family protein